MQNATLPALVGLAVTGVTLIAEGAVLSMEMTGEVNNDTAIKLPAKLISQNAGVEADVYGLGMTTIFALYGQDLPGIMAHTGFSTAATAAYSDISGRLDSDAPVTVTGHSLGGAVAALITLYLEGEGYDVERVYTFGQPKVTDADGADENSEIDIIRVVNGEDVVSIVPPFDPNGTVYEHFGDSILIEADGSDYTYNDQDFDLGLDTNASDAWDAITGGQLLQSIEDHSIDNAYIPNLEALIEDE